MNSRELVDRFGECAGVREIHASEVESLRASLDLTEQAVRAPIEVIHGDNAVTGLEHVQHGRDCSKATGEGVAASGRIDVLGDGRSLEHGDAAFACVPGWVVASGVFEPLMFAGRRLGVGGGEGDRGEI